MRHTRDEENLFVPRDPVLCPSQEFLQQLTSSIEKLWWGKGTGAGTGTGTVDVRHVEPSALRNPRQAS